MGYRDALVAAGAEVIAFHEEDDWQGRWAAIVHQDGEDLAILGHFGSCSGCDAYQAEFEYSCPWCDEHYCDAQENCPDCAAAVEQHATKLAEFGRGYVECAMPVAEAIANLDEDFDGEILDFLKEYL